MGQIRYRFVNGHKMSVYSGEFHLNNMSVNGYESQFY